MTVNLAAITSNPKGIVQDCGPGAPHRSDAEATYWELDEKAAREAFERMEASETPSRTERLGMGLARIIAGSN